MQEGPSRTVKANKAVKSSADRVNNSWSWFTGGIKKRVVDPPSKVLKYGTDGIKKVTDAPAGKLSSGADKAAKGWDDAHNTVTGAGHKVEAGVARKIGLVEWFIKKYSKKAKTITAEKAKKEFNKTKPIENPERDWDFEKTKPIENPEIDSMIDISDPINRSFVEAISSAPVLRNSDKHSFCFKMF